MRKRAVKNPPNANRTVRQITATALGRRYSMHFQKSSFMAFLSSITQIRPLKSQAKPSASGGLRRTSACLILSNKRKILRSNYST